MNSIKGYIKTIIYKRYYENNNDENEENSDSEMYNTYFVILEIKDEDNKSYKIIGYTVINVEVNDLIVCYDYIYNKSKKEYKVNSLIEVKLPDKVSHIINRFITNEELKVDRIGKKTIENVDIDKVNKYIEDVKNKKGNINIEDIDKYITEIKDEENKKYKKHTISQRLKTLVWNTWIGEEIGKSKCLCCKFEEITQRNFSCGHKIAESKGGETNVDNLRPICHMCNFSMGTRDMDEFIKTNGFDK